MPKILLVDDDLKFTSVVRNMLEESGHQVRIATRAAEAADLLKYDLPALAIVDGQLPDTDGVTLIETIRRNYPDLLLLFVSAHWRDAETYLKLKGELKVSVVIHKPVPPVVLAGHVQRLVGITLTDKRRGSAIAALANLSCEFAKELPGEITRITQLINTAKNNRADADSLREARRHAHMLRGTAATYGFPDVGTQMGSLEDTIILLQSSGGGSEAMRRHEEDEAWEKMAGILYNANACHASTAPQTEPEPEPDRKQPILVVSQEKGAINVLRPLRQFFDLEHSYEKIELARAENAGAVVIRIQPNCDLGGYYKLAASIKDHTGGKSIVTFWTQDHVPEVQKLYLGLEQPLGVPPTLESLSAFANQIIRNRRSPSILVIDDDLNFVRKVEAVLSYEGMIVRGFQESSRVVEILEHCNPDLLLLDGDMPGLDGFEICRILRNSKRWKDLPIVFVTALTAWQARVSAFEAGADDFLTKPVVNAELIARVNTRLGRQLLKVDQAHFDQLTGLLIHSKFVQRVDEMRLEAPLSAALLEFANLDAINSTLGVDRGDLLLSTASELLRHRFGRREVRGRWSGGKLILASPCEPEILTEAVELFVQELKPMIEFSLQVRSTIVHIDGAKEDLHHLLVQKSRVGG